MFLPDDFGCAANFYYKLYIPLQVVSFLIVIDKTHRVVHDPIVLFDLAHVFCHVLFYTCLNSFGQDSNVDTYLWRRTISYFRFVRRHCAVCRDVSDKSRCVAGVKTLRHTATEEWRKSHEDLTPMLVEWSRL